MNWNAVKEMFKDSIFFNSDSSIALMALMVYFYNYIIPKQLSSSPQ